MIKNISDIKAAGLFILLLAFTLVIYWPGLNSPFIFDDIPNLSPMGRYNELGILKDMALFILEGDSGPTGRPVSLASFYLDDHTWAGASVSNFKYTNLMMHLLNGVLIFWLSLKLSSYLSLTKVIKNYLALLATMLWLLHPIQINTVLYVIQRMTELSALFTLIGLICYLYGREALPKTPLKAWLLLLGGGSASLVLAILSKENGILLIVYILVIEYYLLRPQGAYIKRSLNVGLYLVIWFPFFLLLGYLGNIALSNSYTARAFSLNERLMTEPRILWDYLSNILLPSLRGNSLFHDDYIISTGLLSPPETILAITGILLLITLIFVYRLKQPVFAFAIAWFLGGHLLESTTVPLELYFEHRNYLPLYGAMFAIPYYCLKTYEKTEKLKNVLSIGLLSYCLLILLISYQGVQQWTHPVQMISRWVSDHPESQRALEALDAVAGDLISPEERKQLRGKLLRLSQKNKTSSYLVLREQLFKCRAETLTKQDLQQGLAALKGSGFVNATPQVYSELISQWMQNKCGDISASRMISFSQQLFDIEALRHNDMQHLIHYWQAEIQVIQGNLEEVMRHLEAAYNIKPNINTLLSQVNYLSSAGLYVEAISKLESAGKDMCTDVRKCLILKIRQSEFDDFRQILKKRLKEQQEFEKNEKIVYRSTRKE